MKKQTLIVTFHTTAAAMAAEKACREAGLAGRLAPVPRAVSSDCGIAWRCAPETREALTQLLAQKGVAFDTIHEIEL